MQVSACSTLTIYHQSRKLTQTACEELPPTSL